MAGRFVEFQSVIGFRSICFLAGRFFVLVFSCFLALLILAEAGTVRGDVLEVSHVDSYEVKRLSLEPGEAADVEVHIKSIGQPVDGCTVSLLREYDGRLINKAVTDVHGIVRFEKVQAGEYSVVMTPPKGEELESHLAIGDVIFRKRRSK